MNRAELLGAVTEIIAVLDRYADRFVGDVEHDEDLQELREILSAKDEESVTTAAQRCVAEHQTFHERVRRGLGLGPQHQESTFDAIGRVMQQLGESRDAQQELLDVRKVIGHLAGETTLAALARCLRTSKHPEQREQQIRVSEHEEQNVAARKVLGAKDGESTAAAAERLLDKIRQLVKQQDDYDVEIGAILGIAPASDVKRAITHMVQELREARARLESRDAG